MSDHWHDDKQEIAETAQLMEEFGLSSSISGNVSKRLDTSDSADLFAITPSGVPYGSLTSEDVVVVDFELDVVEGTSTPSSESLMHVGIYESRPDVGAAVHTHGVFSSVAAVTGLQIPPIIDEMVVAIGGAIEVADYAPPASEELAGNVKAALKNRNSVILSNHGAVSVGRDLCEALEISRLTERVAKIFVYASLLGAVRTLPDNIVAAEAAIFTMRGPGQLSN